jgi:hypothetical protein
MEWLGKLLHRSDLNPMLCELPQMSVEGMQQVFWLKFNCVEDAVMVRSCFNAICATNGWTGVSAHYARNSASPTDMSEYENVVFVGQLTTETPGGCTAVYNTVKEVFQGAIAIQVNPTPDKGCYAFVHFNTPLEARAAVARTNGYSWPRANSVSATQLIKCSLRI